MSTVSNTFGKLGVLRIVSLSCAGLMFFGASFTWADGPALTHKAQQAPPIKLGSTGSNPMVNPRCTTGTLGALVQDTHGHKYILSNTHVFAGANMADPRKPNPIQHAGSVDTSNFPFVCTDADSSEPKPFQVATLTDYIPLVDYLKTKKNGTVDAAIAEVKAGKVDAEGTILDVGVLSPTPTDPKLDLLVQKSGRTTGITHGKIISIEATVRVYDAPPSPDNPAAALGMVSRYLKQILIAGNLKTGGPVADFGARGDSGSLIVTDTGNAGIPANSPVALLYSGGLRPFPIDDPTGLVSTVFANPIKDVIAQFALGHTKTGFLYFLSFVGKSGTPEPGSPSIAGTLNDPDVVAAARTQERYDSMLMSIPEAVGHGIGLASDGSKGIVIQVFLRKVTPEALEAIPPALDGVSVERLVTGELVMY